MIVVIRISGSWARSIETGYVIVCKFHIIFGAVFRSWIGAALGILFTELFDFLVKCLSAVLNFPQASNEYLETILLFRDGFGIGC